MNITERIINYQNDPNRKKSSSVFLDLASEILKDFPYRLNRKTYLLIPDQRELLENSFRYSAHFKEKIMPVRLFLTLLDTINKFKEMAGRLGFKVITSLDEYHSDGELYDLLGITSVNSNQKEDYNYSSNVNVPLTLSIDDYLKRIFFPVVFKNNTTNRGNDKYLIENMEQLRKILALFELPESQNPNLKEEFVVQEYIKGFDEYNTSIRVVITCTGDIIYSQFLVSEDKTVQTRVKEYGIGIDNPCEKLTDPNSEYYLNSKNIISNYAGGSRVIPLDPLVSKLTDEDKKVLLRHGFNIETLELPETIVEQCKEITSQLGNKKGIILGMDFIYSPSNNKWYYLEANRNPSMEGYRSFMNLDAYHKEDIKTLIQFYALTKIVENIMTRDLEEEIKRLK